MVNDNNELGFSLIGCSVRGASHHHSGKPNQDSYKISYISGMIIMAAADGHGSDSCPYSKTGSRIAVNTFHTVINDYYQRYSGDMKALFSFLRSENNNDIACSIDVQWKRKVLRDYVRKSIRTRGAKKRIKATANRESIYKMYGTTLLGLVITHSFIFVYQLGDGDIVYANADRAEHIISGDKLLGTETYSMSKIDARKHAKLKAIPIANKNNGHSYMLFTDGFSNSYHSEQAFLHTVSDYYAVLNEHGAAAVEENLSKWLNETSRDGSGDDITALIAYKQ